MVPDTDAEAVAADKAALTLAFGGTDTAGSVTQDITLPASGSSGTTITWSSDTTGIVANDGTVNRPTFGSGDASVTLTATISKGEISETKTFIITVKEAPQADAEAVAADKAALTLAFGGTDTAGSVTQHITLPASGSSGTTITWSSDTTGIVANDGTVNRPTFGSGDASVTLTATISKGTENVTKIFDLTVKESPQTATPENITVTSGLINQTITVAWDAVNGADSYNLYWATGSGVTKASGTKITGVTSPHSHIGLANGSDYFYIVTAVSSSGGESAATSEATAYPHLRPLRTGLNGCWDDSGSSVICAGTGQDGEYQKGHWGLLDGPNQHSIYTTDYTTTDNSTGLIWKTCPVGQSGADCLTGSPTTMNWATATGATTGCGALNSANSGNGYAGRTDWRVPTISELETIVRYNSSVGPAIISNTKFPFTFGGSYWSTSTFTPSTTEAWGIDFSSGSIYILNKTATYPVVRCVSGGTPLPTASYTDNGDETVTDKATGLTWQQCSAGRSGTDCSTGTADSFTWTAALSYCNNLTLTGRNWRLPNINELKSMVDRSKATGTRIDLPTFPDTIAAEYWSASTYVYAMGHDQDTAWFVNFADGQMNGASKSGNSNYVRCVSDSD